MNPARNLAFSLIELSIILVILGLITGGILTGQSLTKAAELRAITTEFREFQTGVYAFKGKYFALPGDISNAHEFWGVAGGAGMIGDGCESASGSGTETCSGDGDNAIEENGTNRYAENFTFWQHLSNAELIAGQFTGITGPSFSDDATPGENVPASTYPGAGWSVDQQEWPNATRYNINYAAHTLEFGANETGSDVDQPVLIPEDAWNIDKKIDDGLPAKGQVIAFFWNNQCASANDGSNSASNVEASYNLSVDTIECALIFDNPF